jgi:hypothetical protein
VNRTPAAHLQAGGMASAEITDHRQAIFRVESHGAKGAGLDAGETGLARLGVNGYPAGFLVFFKGIVRAGVDAFTFPALTANENLRLIPVRRRADINSRLLQAVVSTLDRRAGQLA